MPYSEYVKRIVREYVLSNEDATEGYVEAVTYGWDLRIAWQNIAIYRLKDALECAMYDDEYFRDIAELQWIGKREPTNEYELGVLVGAAINDGNYELALSLVKGWFRLDLR